MGDQATGLVRRERRWAPVSRQLFVAVVAASGIATFLVLRFLVRGAAGFATVPLLVVLAAGGLLLIPSLVWNALHARFGSDQLAGISIVVSVLLGEYLAGAIVVLMLSGGETLENFVVARATSALRALASRVPTLAHRLRAGAMEDVGVADVRVGDELVILPYEICPVDGAVIEGHGAMDESYLTGEPFTIPKGNLGVRIRVVGEGNAGPFGGPRGGHLTLPPCWHARRCSPK